MPPFLFHQQTGGMYWSQLIWDLQGENELEFKILKGVKQVGRSGIYNFG